LILDLLLLLQLKIILFLIPYSSLIVADGYKDFISKGDSLYNQFNFEAALLQYNRAYAIAPNEFDVLFKLTRVYNDLGEEYYEQRDEKKSEFAVNKALEYALEFKANYPDSAQVYSHLAWSYGNVALYKGGNEKVELAHEIKNNAEESIRRNKNDYLPYIILGIYHRQIASLSWLERLFANTFFGDVPDGSFEESERYLLKALQLKPGIVIATFHLSLVYREIDEEEKEIETLRKILQLPERDFRDKYAKKKAKKRLDELID
jgi:tetratricopeptide (TPR) repeat protein